MKKHRINVPPITAETTLANARRWLNIIRFGESGTVIQLQDDCEFRILEIIKNPKILRKILGPFFKKYLFSYLSLDEKDLFTTLKGKLIELCLAKKIGTSGTLSKLTHEELLSEIASKGYDVGLFITHITSLLKKDFQPLYDLENLIRTSKNLSAVVFSEVDITHEKYNQLVDKASFLFDHIIKYSFYSEADSRQFIAHYNSHWQFSLPNQAIDEIIKSCGGYLWLIHHGLRNLRDNQLMSVDEAVADELMLRKLEVIWTKFTEKERDIIRKAYYGNLQESDTLRHEYDYLRTISIIKETGKKVELGIPLFSLVIEKENRLKEFRVKDDRIFIGERDITSALSRKERSFMLLMLTSLKKIVARDKAAQIIWGENWEEKYSDWAIDRLVHRIRKKLKALRIDEKLLKTVKKKGFIFG